MDEQPLLDRSYLQQVAYDGSAKLADRASIYQYRQTPGELGPWVLSHTDWPAGARVLDVGCGPGQYLRLLRQRTNVLAVGADLSEGMCHEAVVHASVVSADAASLPFPDAAFDRVLAPHMLYHCADIPAAIADLRRVLRPGGTVLVVVNSRDHMAELRAVMRAVTGRDGLRVGDRITLENGDAMLAAAFDVVTVDTLADVLQVPSPEPVLTYIQSMAEWHGDLAPEVAAAELERRLASVIAEKGAFEIHACAGVFICS